MAKTRQDFINEGRANAIKMQAPIGSVPEFANSGSWQAKAYLEGWNLGAQDHAESFAAQRRPVGNAEVSLVDKSAARQQSPKQTAQKHIIALHSEAGRACETKNYSRVNRIMAKVDKLSAKWGL